jgi:tetratricopeptide (TPR) repeat protein
MVSLPQVCAAEQGALAVVGLILFFLVLLGGAGFWWAQQRAGAAGEARAALAEATDLLEKERWPEALSAARRAEAVLAGVGADADLRRQVHELIRDLKMAERLQEARLRGTAVKDGHFDYEATDEAYAAAFAEYGLDVDRLDVQASADQIRLRPIHQQLVAALDDWARVRKELKGAGWRQRLAVARAADPDVWRNRLRGALEQKGPKALEEAAAADTASEWPVSTITLLGTLARGTPSNDRVAAVLVRAQQRHPGDFWINETLGLLLMHTRPPRPQEAISYYMIAVALRPQSPGARLNLGRALRQQRRLDDAIAEYREAIRLKKDYVEAHDNLGNALCDKGRLEEAIAEHREAIRLKKDDAPAHDNLGNALCDKGRLEEAIAEFREAIRLEKDYAGAHNNLGTALCDKGRLEEAIAEHREAIRLKKDYAEAHNDLGAALHEQHRLDEAIGAFREAIRLKKDDALAHYKLGNALRDKGRLEEAIAEYREAIRLKKDYAEAHNNLGLALADKGQLDDAIAEYRKAIASRQVFPEAHRAHLNLGATLHAQGDVKGAIACYTKALQLDPKYAKAHNNLGLALQAQGDWKGSIACYRQSLALDPNAAATHVSLGNALAAQGDWKGAIACYHKALALDPKDARTHYNLGNALKGQGDVKGAIACYRKALALDPKDAEAHCNLGQVLQEQGHFTQALQALKRGHQLGSQRPDWRYPSARWVDDCQRLLDLDTRLPALLQGDELPKDTAEQLALADLCQHYKKRYAAAARFYADAFAAGVAQTTRRAYAAACAAALAASGKGEDAAQLVAKEKTRLRQQALAWLKHALKIQGKLLEDPERQKDVWETLQHWQKDADLAAVRGDEALAKLPADEQAGWRQLWADVEKTLARARQENKRPEK